MLVYDCAGVDGTARQLVCTDHSEPHLGGVGVRVQRACSGLCVESGQGVKVQERQAGRERLQLQVLRAIPGQSLSQAGGLGGLVV